MAGHGSPECTGPRGGGVQALETGGADACRSSASEADQAQHMLLAADIKRFLERPAETMRIMPPPDAPPGAPIGDTGMDWLAPAPLCTWNSAHPDTWMWMPPM